MLPRISQASLDSFSHPVGMLKCFFVPQGHNEALTLTLIAQGKPPHTSKECQRTCLHSMDTVEHFFTSYGYFGTSSNSQGLSEALLHTFLAQWNTSLHPTVTVKHFLKSHGHVQAAPDNQEHHRALYHTPWAQWNTCSQTHKPSGTLPDTHIPHTSKILWNISHPISVFKNFLTPHCHIGTHLFTLGSQCNTFLHHKGILEHFPRPHGHVGTLSLTPASQWEILVHPTCLQSSS